MKVKKCPDCVRYADMWQRAEAKLANPVLHTTQLQGALEDKEKELVALKKNYNFICDRLTQLEGK